MCMPPLPPFQVSGLSARAYATFGTALQKLGGRGMLPSVETFREARRELENIALDDLARMVYPTPGDLFISMRPAVEMEILRLIQEINGSKNTRREAGRRITCVEPDGHGWRDFDTKIALDVLRITRRTSQTEAMLLI